jgi:hypothetical protein
VTCCLKAVEDIVVVGFGSEKFVYVYVEVMEALRMLSEWESLLKTVSGNLHGYRSSRKEKKKYIKGRD